MASTTSRHRNGGEGADRATPRTEFRHGAVFYRDEDEFLAGLVPPIRDALAAGQPVLAALKAPNTRRLQAELGDEAERVGFLEMEKVGVNPARIIPVWREFVEANVSRDRPALGIGEPICADRSADELVECQHHEALLNVAFRDDPAWTLLCPYDMSLDDSVLEEAKRSHPVLVRGEAERASEEFATAPHGRPFNGPLSDAPADADTVQFGADGVGMVRERVAGRARAAGLSDMRTYDLVLAVNELTANSVRHGGGGGELSLWEQDIAGRAAAPGLRGPRRRQDRGTAARPDPAGRRLDRRPWPLDGEPALRPAPDPRPPRGEPRPGADADRHRVGPRRRR